MKNTILKIFEYCIKTINKILCILRYEPFISNSFSQTIRVYGVAKTAHKQLKIIIKMYWPSYFNATEFRSHGSELSRIYFYVLTLKRSSDKK